MHVKVMLKPPSEGEEYREKSFHAVPQETVDELMEAHTNHLNEEPGAPKSVTYSFQRTDGGAGRLSLNLEMVASIDAFEEDDWSPGGSRGGGPMVA